MKTIAIVAAALLATLTSTAAFAQDKEAPTPESSKLAHRGVGGHAATTMQLNPNVLKLDAGVHYRHQWFQAGAGVHATPSYVAPAIQLEAHFAETFSLKGEYAYMRYTSHGRGLLAFPTKDANFDSAVLERMDPQSGGTHRVTLTPNGQLTLGPVLLKMKNDISYLHTSERGQSFYMPDYDIVVRKDDLLLASRTDALFRPWKDDTGRAASGLAFGPTLQSTWAVRTNLMRQRIGATVGYTASDRLGFFEKPSIVLDAGINATDEHHQGEAFGALALSTAF